MAQITWRNINAPDFKAAMLGTDAAADRLSNALNPLEQLLKDKTVRDAHNYDAETASIQQAFKDQTQQIQDIGALNQRDEAAMIAQARQQFGSRFDADAFKTGIEAQRNTLRQKAINEVMPDALAAGNTAQDVLATEQALTNRLRSLGVREPGIRQASSDLMANSAADKARYAKTRDLNTQKYLDTVGTPKDEKELNTLIESASASNIPMNLDLLRSRLKEEKQGFLQDRVNAIAKEERAHVLKERALDEEADKAVGNIVNELTKTGDLTGSFNKYGSNLTGQRSINAYNSIRTFYENKKKLLPGQSAQLTATEKANEREIVRLQNNLDDIYTTYHTEAQQASGISDTDLENAKKLDTGIAGIVGALSKEPGDGSLFHLSSWSKDKDGSAAVAAINAPYQNMLSQGIPTDVAAAIILKANKAMSGNDRSAIIGQKVVPATLLTEKVNALAQQWQDAEHLRIKASEFKKKSEREIEESKSIMAQHGIAQIEQFGKANVTDGKIDPESVKKAMDRNEAYTLKGLTESSPLVEAYTKKQEAIKKAQDEAAAKDKLQRAQDEAAAEAKAKATAAEKEQEEIAKTNKAKLKSLGAVNTQDYSNMREKDGWLWGTNSKGQARRIMKVQKPTIQYGLKEYPNPDYQTYLDAIQKNK